MSLRTVGLVAALVLATDEARADGRFGPYDVRSTFVIAKNTDANVVEYGIRLDKDCLPLGNEPMYAYWRQYERGANVTEDLNLLDRTVYGINSQSVLRRGPDESRVLLTVKAAPDRRVTLIVKRTDGKCNAEPISTIGGAGARLERVFVHVAGFMSVDWVEIRGSANGKPIVERIKH